MNYITTYMLALLSTEGKFSCHKSAYNLENISHDKLTRFLTDKTNQQEIDIKDLPKGGALIYDDTSINKTHSKNIEGVRYVWCSATKRALRGFTLVKIIYVVGNKIYNLSDIIWQKEEGTKNEIIRKKLLEFKEAGLEPGIVLFDNWYAACKNLNLINDLGWKYLTLCKSNKIFEKKQVKTLQFFGGKSLRGKARGIYHQVQVVKHGERYIMTNLDKQIMSHTGWLIYKQRWIIETVFRNLKSYLHLEECSSRSLIAQTNHFKACMDAFLFLKNKYSDKSLESAHSHFLDEFRFKKYNNQDVFALVA